jgi:hypothetical protein
MTKLPRNIQRSRQLKIVRREQVKMLLLQLESLRQQILGRRGCAPASAAVCKRSRDKDLRSTSPRLPSLVPNFVSCVSHVCQQWKIFLSTGFHGRKCLIVALTSSGLGLEDY